MGEEKKCRFIVGMGEQGFFFFRPIRGNILPPNGIRGGKRVGLIPRLLVHHCTPLPLHYFSKFSPTCYR